MGNAQAQVGRTGTVGRHSVEVVKYLGEGGSSFIFLVKDTKSSQPYVLKRVVANDTATMALIKNELEFQQRFNHPHVVEYVDHQEQKDRRETEVFILMEYCPGGHLYENMKKMGDKRFTQDQLLRTFRSLCIPIQLLHRNNPPVAHRDIKLENFLLAKNNVYKLCDFGSCVEGPRTLETKQDRIAEIDLVEKRTTAMYRSPELADIEGTAMFGAARLTEAVDIWALGCVLFNMAFFKPPFPPDGLRTSKYTVPAHGYSRDLPVLLKRMLAEDVDDRACIDEVIACVDAMLADQPLPAKGSVAPSTSSSRPGSRTNSGQQPAQRTSSAKPAELATQLAAVDLMSASPAPAPTPAPTPGFADFASFSPPATGGFDAFGVGSSTGAPTAPLTLPSYDPFGAPPAPANKVVDTFGFIVSPTSAQESAKLTQSRDAFEAFEDLNKPPTMPWEQTGKMPMSPMGLHNMQSPTGYQQPAMNYGQPMSPTNYGGGGMPPQGYPGQQQGYPGQQQGYPGQQQQGYPGQQQGYPGQQQGYPPQQGAVGQQPNGSQNWKAAYEFKF